MMMPPTTIRYQPKALEAIFGETDEPFHGEQGDNECDDASHDEQNDILREVAHVAPREHFHQVEQYGASHGRNGKEE